MGFLTFLFILAVLVLFFLIRSYNKLQKKAQQVKEAHSNILVAMRKRIDLVNKLIDIASAYGSHEKLTHIAVSQNANVQELINSYRQTDAALGLIGTIVRNYPELKANETYQLLMKQLTQIEEDLQKKREMYNAVAKDFNITRNTIPTVFIADRLGFKEAPYFSIDVDATEAIKDFKTDDGQMLKELIKDTTAKVAKATEKVSSKVETVVKETATKVINETKKLDRD